MSTEVSGADLSDVDASILDPAWYETLDYLDGFCRLRDEDPVHLVNAPGYGRPFWVLSRYDDVQWGYQNPQLLSSREGSRMPRIGSRSTAERRMEMGLDTRLDFLDDPIHAMYRRPLNKHFSVPAVKRLGPAIAEYVNQIIDQIDDDVEFDFIDRVASNLPIMVVSTLLGIPPEEWDYLHLQVSRVVEWFDPRYVVDGDPTATFQNAYAELLQYAEKLVADRRRDPRDDFATVLGQLSVDHEPMSLREARTSIFGMILGGFDSTRQALGVGTWQMLLHPDQRRALIDDPSLVMGAVDETIRFTTPARSVIRVANEDFELGDKLIRAGDWVSLLSISANRDERKFDRPDEFDITRSPNEYLSFGEGIHKCLGRNLIRLELAIFFPLLFARMPNLEVLETPRWLHDTGASGLVALNLRSGRVLRHQSAR